MKKREVMEVVVLRYHRLEKASLAVLHILNLCCCSLFFLPQSFRGEREREGEGRITFTHRFQFFRSISSFALFFWDLSKTVDSALLFFLIFFFSFLFVVV